MAEREVRLLVLGAAVNGRYEVVRCIKVGGMGAVYEVRDRNVGNRRRALKVMLPNLVSPALRERFRLEAALPAKIDSQYVVDVHEQGVDEESGYPFFVMELLEGEDLGARLQRCGRLPPDEVIVHLDRASRGLDCAHAADVVHRDLKPENLFITRHDEGESLKILDFGIAKIVAESTQANTTLTVGTPLYMSPEQILGDGGIGPTSDVYALAHVAFTLLTGRPYWALELDEMAPNPFIMCVSRGASENAVARAARYGVKLPPAFDAWFARATDVIPHSRFESASELVMELARVLEVAPPRASRAHPWPAGNSERMSPLPQRHRIGAGRETPETATHSTGAVSSSKSADSASRRFSEWLVAGAGMGVITGSIVYGLQQQSSSSESRSTPASMGPRPALLPATSASSTLVPPTSVVSSPFASTSPSTSAVAPVGPARKKPPSQVAESSKRDPLDDWQ